MKALLRNGHRGSLNRVEAMEVVVSYNTRICTHVAAVSFWRVPYSLFFTLSRSLSGVVGTLQRLLVPYSSRRSFFSVQWFWLC